VGGLLVVEVVPDKGPFRICREKLGGVVGKILGRGFHAIEGRGANGPGDMGIGKVEAQVGG